MAYDYKKAIANGASEDQVLDYLNKTRGYNVQGALQAGATKTQLLDYLSTTGKPNHPVAPIEQPKKDNFLQSMIKSPINTLLVKPAARATEAITRTLAPNSMAAKGYEQMADSGEAQNLKVPGLGNFNVPQQKAFGQGGGKQIAGEALETASYLAPYGAMAKGLGVGAKTIGLGSKTAKTVGNITSGAAGGYGFDVGGKLQEGKSVGESLKPGMATAIGAAIPAAGPLVKAGAKGVGRVAGESLGVSTGTGYGAVKEAWQAALQGGKRGQEYLAGLRGTAVPEQIVGEAKDSLGQIIKTRRDAYTQQLGTLAKNETTHDISPIIKEIQKQLTNFKIKTTPQGLDFSRSPLRFNKPAQQDITTIIETMKDFGTRPGDRTVIGIDSLKRALGDLYTPSGEARAFVQGVKNSTKDILKKVPGYDTLTKNYAEKTDLIHDIQKALSLGDKSSVDTAFKKLTTALRTNNEFRKELIAELDKASGGHISSKIAGQQMSELLPRGIMRQIGGVGAVGGLATGVGIVPLLKAALFTSPRLVGEFINALGFSVRKTKGGVGGLWNAIEKTATGGQPLQFPGDKLLSDLKK